MDAYEKAMNSNIKSANNLDETEMEFLQSTFEKLGIPYTSNYDGWQSAVHTAFTTFNFDDYGKFKKQTPNTITEIIRIPDRP
jgi:hypothetical protein